MRPLLIFLALTTLAFANPEPDIPVHCHFDKDGTCTITVEVDPRCFTTDPMSERYVMKVDLTCRSNEALTALKQQAVEAIAQWIEFQPEPAQPQLKPEFTLAFTGQNQVKLINHDDPVVVTATWKFKRPAGMTSWRIHATSEARYSIVVRNFIDGVEQKKFSILFPGETSIAIDTAAPR
jgi:hypothetical protein